MSCINLKAVGPVDLIAPHETHLGLLYLWPCSGWFVPVEALPEERETDTRKIVPECIPGLKQSSL